MNNSQTTTPHHVDTPAVAPAPMLESEARNWAMMVHFLAIAAMFISGGFLSFVVPLVIWLTQRRRSALIDFHGKQNLNLQLTLLGSGIVAVLIGVAAVGIGLLVTLPMFFAYGLYAFIISIVAGAKANNGEYYRIPFAITFIR